MLAPLPSNISRQAARRKAVAAVVINDEAPHDITPRGASP